MPYDYGYYNYNRRTYVDRRRYNTTIINNTTVINPPNGNNGRAREISPVLPLDRVPKTAVVSVAESEFGRGRDFRMTPPELAGKILSKKPSELENSPVLPTLSDLNGNVGREIRAKNPNAGRMVSEIKTGAMDRKIGDASMDSRLRTERIYGDRAPVRNPNTETRTNVESIPQIRDTGAVKRAPRPIFRQENDNSDAGNSSPREISPPIRSTGGKSDDSGNDQSAPKPRKVRERDDNIIMSPPSYEPPRTERREVRPLPPSSEQQPKREEPRPQPPASESKPPKSEPPPRKAEPIPIAPTEGKGKGNRDN